MLPTTEHTSPRFCAPFSHPLCQLSIGPLSSVQQRPTITTMEHQTVSLLAPLDRSLWEEPADLRSSNAHSIIQGMGIPHHARLAYRPQPTLSNSGVIST